MHSCIERVLLVSTEVVKVRAGAGGEMASTKARARRRIEIDTSICAARPADTQEPSLRGQAARGSASGNGRLAAVAAVSSPRTRCDGATVGDAGAMNDARPDPVAHRMAGASRKFQRSCT